MAVDHLDRDLDLADGVHLRSGDRIVDLHLWNEQVSTRSGGWPDDRLGKANEPQP
jgi:hypothetical protein